MDQGNRITQIEDEVKVLKNEMLAVLLDVKETLLNRENPFSTQPKYDNNSPNITINQGSNQPQQQPATPPTPKAIDPEPESEPVELHAETSVPDPDILEEELNEELEEEAVEEDEIASDDCDEEEDEEDEVEFNVNLPKSQNIHSGSNGNKNGNGHGNGENIMSKQENAPFTRIIEAMMEPDSNKQWQEAATEQNGKHEAICTFGDRIDLKTLSALSDWVVETTDQIGPENTQYILDVSEMVGHLPAELKKTMERIIPKDLSPRAEEKISPKVYLKCLNNLALLLGRENASDFIVFHIASQGLSSLSRNG
jgi:hypothetical protein